MKVLTFLQKLVFRLSSSKFPIIQNVDLTFPCPDLGPESSWSLWSLSTCVTVSPRCRGHQHTHISQALWLRNLAYQEPDIQETDLVMISESDVFISSPVVLRPLANLGYR